MVQAKNRVARHGARKKITRRMLPHEISALHKGMLKHGRNFKDLKADPEFQEAFSTFTEADLSNKYSHLCQVRDERFVFLRESWPARPRMQQQAMQETSAPHTKHADIQVTIEPAEVSPQSDSSSEDLDESEADDSEYSGEEEASSDSRAPSAANPAYAPGRGTRVIQDFDPSTSQLVAQFNVQLEDGRRKWLPRGVMDVTARRPLQTLIGRLKVQLKAAEKEAKRLCQGDPPAGTAAPSNHKTRRGASPADTAAPRNHRTRLGASPAKLSRPRKTAPRPLSPRKSPLKLAAPLDKEDGGGDDDLGSLADGLRNDQLTALRLHGSSKSSPLRTRQVAAGASSKSLADDEGTLSVGRSVLGSESDDLDLEIALSEDESQARPPVEITLESVHSSQALDSAHKRALQVLLQTTPTAVSSLPQQSSSVQRRKVPRISTEHSPSPIAAARRSSPAGSAEWSSPARHIRRSPIKVVSLADTAEAIIPDTNLPLSIVSEDGATEVRQPPVPSSPRKSPAVADRLPQDRGKRLAQKMADTRKAADQGKTNACPVM